VYYTTYACRVERKVVFKRGMCNPGTNFNPLDARGNNSSISNNTRLVLWWVGCYIWYSEEGTGQAAAPPSSLLDVPNVTAHPLTASVPITVLLYDGPFLGGFNVVIKGLKA